MLLYFSNIIKKSLSTSRKKRKFFVDLSDGEIPCDQEEGGWVLVLVNGTGLN